MIFIIEYYTSSNALMSNPIDIPRIEPFSSPDDFQSQNSSFSSNNSIVVGSPKPKKKSNRCVICRKKLGLLPFICKCEQMYCALHRHPEDHECTFDHLSRGRNTLKKNLIKVDGDKIQNRL